jgi:hypothetical protein
MGTPEGEDEVVRADRRAVERWFDERGLPYFVDETRASVHAALGRRRLVTLITTTALVAVLIGVVAGIWAEDGSSGALAGAVAFGLPVSAYGLTTLRGVLVARWAGRRTLTSLGLLLPLVTRALPLLLLFVTFLFINTEVWQVASSMDDGVLWIAVLLFATVAVAFLLVRLPEELDHVDGTLTGERLVAACAGTPVAALARARADQLDHATAAGTTRVTGFARANLVLVLLVSQALQVLLLALAVFAFFLVFGAVAIQPDVIDSWIGHQPTWVFGDVHFISLELARVSVFLAAFSGLYFTVYAVSDETYRAQFFASLMVEIEQAVGVRAIYQTMAPDAAG